MAKPGNVDTLEKTISFLQKREGIDKVRGFAVQAAAQCARTPFALEPAATYWVDVLMLSATPQRP